MAVTIYTSPADFAQKILYLDGKPFSMDGLPYMVQIMNTKAEKMILMTGRQVAKSTTISALAITELASHPFWRSLYVAPRAEQALQFNNDKLAPMLTNSPVLKEHFIDASCKMQATMKELKNGSAMYLRSCFHTPDAIRGISANSIYLDEVQDLDITHLPVIEECTARKNPKRMIFAGTPKTMDNTINQIWKESSQHYWAMKCDHCGKWNVPIQIENLGPEGLICRYCGGSLNVSAGEYVAMHPERDFIGYHVSQAMIAGVPQTGIPWTRLWEKVNNPLYTQAKFHNECLGEPWDVGTKLLTEADVIQCCDSSITELTLFRKAEWGMYSLVAALDWGVVNGNTHTVLTLGGIDKDNKLRVIFSKKFPCDQEPLTQMDEIVETLNRVNPAIIVCDRGGGSLANSMLRKKMPNKRVYEIEYHATVNKGMYFNQDSHSWVTDRTRAIGGVVLDIRAGEFKFPAYDLMKDEFAPDLLTLSCEYNEKLRNFRIIREESVPDDFAHTLVYLRLGARYFLQNPYQQAFMLDDFLPPDKESATIASTDYELRKASENFEDD